MSWIPPRVRELVAEVEDNAGVTPAVHRVASNIWRLTIENERVKNVIDYKVTAGGRVKWHRSTLWVDGVEHPLCNTHEAFYELFLYTDEVLARGTEPVRLPEMPPAVTDWENAPHVIKSFIRTVGVVAERTGMHIEIGATEHVWVIQLTDDEKECHQQLVRFTAEDANGRWYLHRPLLVRDGKAADLADLSPAVAEQIRLIMDGPLSTNAQPGRTLTGTSDARTTATGVAVRRTTVIRN